MERPRDARGRFIGPVHLCPGCHTEGPHHRCRGGDRHCLHCDRCGYAHAPELAPWYCPPDDQGTP